MHVVHPFVYSLVRSHFKSFSLELFFFLFFSNNMTKKYSEEPAEITSRGTNCIMSPKKFKQSREKDTVCVLEREIEKGKK